MRHRAWLPALAILFVAGCGDKTIALTYAPGPPTSALPGAQAVTVFAFRDARGDEGDGHPNRVGGIYGGYGNQLSKVWTPRPWIGTQRIMNDALSQFVQRVITDPDITARLTGGKRSQ